MFDIGPDMEELLRRAAENYPLRKPEDRWQEIEAGIATRKTGSAHKRLRLVLPLLITFLLMFGSLQIADLYITWPVARANDQTGQQDRSPAQDSLIGREIPNANQVIELQLGKHIVAGNIDKSPDSIEAKNRFSNPGQPAVASTGFSAQTAIGYDLDGQLAGNNLQPVYPKADIAVNDQIESESEKQVLPETAVQPLLTKPAQKLNKHRRFYAGLQTAANLSRVKRTSIHHAGYSAGLMAGWHFSNRFALETGLFYAKKVYRSKGTSFDMKEMKSSMPAGMELMELSGGNKVIEMPVQLRYQFTPGYGRGFFAAAGISSYLLLCEKNEYHMRYNGNEQMMDGHYDIKRRYFAGTINISAGYQLTAGKTMIRFEPYTQLPVKGIGIGVLPVTSFGLRFAVLR